MNPPTSKLLDESQDTRIPRAFWKLLAGYSVSAFGDGMYLIAINWWILEATGSAAVLGTVATIGAITLAALGPLSGRLVDRFGSVPLLISSDIWRAVVLSVFVGVAAVADEPPAISFFVLLVLLMTVGSSFSMPGVFALIPTLVPSHSVRRANSILATSRSLAVVGGPAFSGILIAAFGVNPSLLINIGTFLVSALCLFTIRGSRSEQTRRSSSEDGRVSALRVLLGRRITTFALSTALVGNLALGMYTVALPIKFSTMSDPNSSVLYGVTQAAFQVGMLLLGVLLSLKKSDRIVTKSLYVFVGVIMMAAGILGVGASSSPAIMVPSALLVGASLMFISVLSDPQLQLQVPEGHRGAVQGVVQGVGGALRPLGIASATIVATSFGIVAPFVFAAIMLALLGALIVSFNGYRDASEEAHSSAGGPNA